VAPLLSARGQKRGGDNNLKILIFITTKTPTPLALLKLPKLGREGEVALGYRLLLQSGIRLFSV